MHAGIRYVMGAASDYSDCQARGRGFGKTYLQCQNSGYKLPGKWMYKLNSAKSRTLWARNILILHPSTSYGVSHVDPGRQNPCVVATMDKFTPTTESCGEKGTEQPLSRGEPLTLALTGFYCFSGHITLRMVLIYYAQIRFRQLQKTKERVLLIT